jgi:hypothetical protein
MCVLAAAVCLIAGCSAGNGGRRKGWEKQAPIESAGKDSVTVIPGAAYSAGKIKKIIAGEHYRQAWLTPVTVPVFDIQKEKGGLTPIKTGGNMQSLTLHMQAKDGRRYVLRSVQKNPVKTIPHEFRRSFVVNVVQDQVSTLHPYGALAAAQLAKAAGVYHTNPKLVYIPCSDALGQYKNVHCGMLAIFEEKPIDNWAQEPSFGRSGKIIETDEMIEHVLSGTNYHVDERAFARARLLDILIGDWDRSEDQWAWASFTHDSITVYKPIPRDRDQAFVTMDGFIPWMYSRKWANRKYQGFTDEIHDMKGLNYNARWIDRSFLTTLTSEDWKSIADSVKAALTDEVITSVIKQMPASHVYADEMIDKLKKRRDDLTAYADMYYKELSDEVCITGSEGSELFEVKRLSNDCTLVQMYQCRVSVKPTGDEEVDKEHKQLKAEKIKLVYSRTFLNSETDEVVLYGLGGSDVFDVSGEVSEGLLLRIVGGDGYDRISDRSTVKGFRKRTKVYDISERNDLVLGDESKDLTSFDVRVNDHVRDDFNYDEYAPKVLLEYNVDEGFFIGGGVSYKHYSFRKEPYSQLHELSAAASIKTGAYYFKYHGDYISLFRKWDMEILAEATPHFTTTYFGLGNETQVIDVRKDDDEEEYNRFRINQWLLKPGVKRSSGHNTFGIGPELRYVQVREQGNNFISSEEAGLSNDDFKPAYYAGLYLQHRYRNVDNELLPRQGFAWKSIAEWNSELNRSPQAFSRLSSEVNAYIPVPGPFSATLALRLGAAANFDDFRFWQANYIGGTAVNDYTLRGYRSNRFAGRANAYQDTELRIKLLNFEHYGEAGIFGFIDHGRVWVDGEQSQKLHRGYGGGMWIAPFNKWVITGTLGISEEDMLFNLGTGFSF